MLRTRCPDSLPCSQLFHTELLPCFFRLFWFENMYLLYLLADIILLVSNHNKYSKKNPSELKKKARSGEMKMRKAEGAWAQKERQRANVEGTITAYHEVALCPYHDPTGVDFGRGLYPYPVHARSHDPEAEVVVGLCPFLCPAPAPFPFPFRALVVAVRGRGRGLRQEHVVELGTLMMPCLPWHVEQRVAVCW